MRLALDFGRRRVVVIEMDPARGCCLDKRSSQHTRYFGAACVAAVFYHRKGALTNFPGEQSMMPAHSCPGIQTPGFDRVFFVTEDTRDASTLWVSYHLLW
jgi:hypothetical protein